MSGALPQQPEEFLDHVRNMPHDHVPSVEEELDEYLMLREVRYAPSEQTAPALKYYRRFEITTLV